MSPCEASKLPTFLEHPKEAFDYFERNKVNQVICEEKHMGSRAVLVICKVEKVALKRFGIENEGFGKCFTRTGRNFFNDEALELAFSTRVQKALTKADFWNEMDTDWVCLDTELMPWSAKAQSLLKDQYAAVGTAAHKGLSDTILELEKTIQNGNSDAVQYLESFKMRLDSNEKYIKAYRQYCWEVNSLDDYKLAPFHILATEGAVHTDKNHTWHME